MRSGTPAHTRLAVAPASAPWSWAGAWRAHGVADPLRVWISLGSVVSTFLRR